ncbi:hypothetical protein LOTGIDRAFT_162794 [Lottia gigantea]|uniref:Uncharacterized protein n=1 Tax=Lottia gigantea TaxID=225164 RepID=V3ZLA0_LOTGI|nr:hypothetical protein LOTGIDRAFT_162794 [Lottia gigantea]ESO92143.1 hypothetical protein LOTGIDRAFT_162794 [Lottia gigantea]
MDVELATISLSESHSEVISYPSPGSGLSFLCGCVSATQYNKIITITCYEGDVIQMEPNGYTMRDDTSRNNYFECGSRNHGSCKSDFTTISYTSIHIKKRSFTYFSGRRTLYVKDRMEIYKKCTLQKSCDIMIAGVQQDQERLVNYPYYCHSANSLHDISVKVERSKKGILYFTGKKFIGQKIDCDCSVTRSTEINVEIFFIHLKPHTCSNVKIFTTKRRVLRCSRNDTILLHMEEFKSTHFKLEIRGMEPDGEDVIFLKVGGKA